MKGHYPVGRLNSATGFTLPLWFGCLALLLAAGQLVKAATGPDNPNVRLTRPVTGSSFPGPASLLLEASATDIGGTVTNVEFWVGDVKLGEDASEPFSYLWPEVAVGPYVLTAVTYDNDGMASTSAPVHITVVSNQPPMVSILAPTNRAVFNSPAQILVSAEAFDSDDPVASVEFFRNGRRVVTLTSPPFEYLCKDVVAGDYCLKAVATDSLGAQSTSAPVSISVTGAVAALHVIHITVDGLAAQYLGACVTNQPSEFPSFVRLMNEGGVHL